MDRHSHGGSFTTISEAMTEWKARKAARETPMREPAPAVIVEHLEALGTEIWRLALELANGRLASEREALEAARTELEGQKAEAAELADQVSAELETLQKKTAGLEAELAATLRESEAMRASLALANERAGTAEARAEEITRRADDLNVELARVNAQNAELIHALSATAIAAKEKPTSE
jgi:chromosome segregation ATPase